ncbi:30943_t:CDS:1, partial [Racocetra persica]
LSVFIVQPDNDWSPSDYQRVIAYDSLSTSSQCFVYLDSNW